MMDNLLLYFKKCVRPAKRLAKALSTSSQQIDIHRFPDGESLVTLPQRLSEIVIIYACLNNPDEKLIQLLFTAKGLKAQGVKKIILVAPYMCYMRQDKSFLPGQVVSQRIIGDFLSELFDWIITVDAHLHRVHNIQEVFSRAKAINLSASDEIAHFISNLESKAILIGPDEESYQWVEKIAQRASVPFGVCKKTRLGDRNVEIEVPEIDFSSYEKIFLIDDIVSSGKTAAVAAKKLKDAGAKNIECIVTHAVFAKGATKILENAGINNIITTDSIPHKTNKIKLAPVLSEAICNILGQG